MADSVYQLPQFITELTLILLLAGVTSIICRALHQPALLGYVLAGFLMSPHFSWIPNISDTKSLHTWADIGVIFLLFGLGLEFSFRKLMKIGAQAFVTASVEVPIMILMGFLIGRFMNWSVIDSIFLGSILAIASTTVVGKVFDEYKLKQKQFAHLALGLLIFEDLVAIVLLIFLSAGTIALENFTAPLVISTIFKLAFFIVAWYVAGILFLPGIFRFIEPYMTREIRLIVVTALCFGMVYLTTNIGFSPALGAFVMGSLLAETDIAKKIEEVFGPTKDLFGAIFFVSVGMLLDPQILFDYGPQILIITVIFVFTKSMAVASGAIIAGISFKQSIRAGLSVSQIGEFSFILASVGLTAKVVNPALYPMAVAIFFITSILTPTLVRNSEGIANFLEKKLPAATREKLSHYQGVVQRRTAKSQWQAYLRQQALTVFLLVVGVTGISLSISYLVHEKIFPDLELSGVQKTLSFLFTIALVSPLLYGLALGTQKRPETSELWQNKGYRGPIFILITLRSFLSLLLLVIIFGQYFHLHISLLLGTVIFALMFWILSKYIEKYYQKVSHEFMTRISDHLSNKKDQEIPILAPWEVQLVPLRLSSHSPYAGKTLLDSNIREKYGVTIALIDRDGKHFRAPDSDFLLMPGDDLYTIGTEEQIETLRTEIERNSSHSPSMTEFSLNSIQLPSSSSLVGKSIKDSGIREKLSALIVGIERSGQRILNPDAAVIFEPEDVLWIVGESKSVQDYLKN